MVGLKLNAISDIVTLFLYYTLLILVVKAVVWAITFVNRAKGLHPIAAALGSAVDNSLFVVLIISTLSIWKEDEQLTISQLCYVSIWLFVAEIARILGSAFLSFDAISIFGLTV